MLGVHLPLSMARSLSGGRNRPALRFGAEVAFSASSFLGGIGPQIDLGALKAGVTEP
jgi:hypothetical protein